jgi:hypothetical protein
MLSTRVGFFLTRQWALFLQPSVQWYPAAGKQFFVDDDDDTRPLPDAEIKRLLVQLSEFQFQLQLGVHFRF